jgi:hypothetical protein
LAGTFVVVEFRGQKGKWWAKEFPSARISENPQMHLQQELQSFLDHIKERVS